MKKYIQSTVEYDEEMVNLEDAKYYDKLYEVGLWGGIGYKLNVFRVYANDEETALEKVVAYCEDKGYYGLIYKEDEIPIFEESNYIYVDATTEGAAYPYYVLSENAYIDEVK